MTTISFPAGTSRPTPTQLAHEVGTVLADLPLFLTAPAFRHWHKHWGATQAEVLAAMPGDDLLPGARFECTRAITIDAPADRVWPWLVQVGCLRGGWYSNDLLDNLAHPSAERILPEFQSIEVGQWVPMTPNPSETTAFRVASFVPNRSLVWEQPVSSWSWQLTGLPDGSTRLVTRLRSQYQWDRPLGALLSFALAEFGDFAMMRRMLRGIKRRAEAPPITR